MASLSLGLFSLSAQKHDGMVKARITIYFLMLICLSFFLYSFVY